MISKEFRIYIPHFEFISKYWELSLKLIFQLYFWENVIIAPKIKLLTTFILWIKIKWFKTFHAYRTNSNFYHTTKITVTFVISHFEIVGHNSKIQSLWNITFFDNVTITKYHISKLVTLQKLNYLYNIAPSKYIILIIIIWRLIDIYFSTFCTLWFFFN